MYEKQLRQLGRRELLELLLDVERDKKRLEDQVQQLEEQLADKDLKISQAGTMAEAALALNGVFEAADASCAQYLENARKLTSRLDEEEERRRRESLLEAQYLMEAARDNCDELKTQARQECEEMQQEARQKCEDLEAEARQRCQDLEAEAQQKCDELLQQTEQEVEKKWEVISQRLGDLYASHQGLLELVAQGVALVPERGAANEQQADS